MISYPPPMSNAERQRKFQARHPGYDRRRKARDRAICQHAVEKLVEQERAIFRAQLAAAKLTPPPVAQPAAKPLLLLPAPVEDPTMAAIKALAISLTAESAKLAIPRR